MSTPEPPSDPSQPSDPPPGSPPPPTGGWPPPDVVGPEADPLVPPPDGGFRAWHERLVATLQRSWQPLAMIMLVTFAGPQIGFAVMLTEVDGLTVGSTAVPLPMTGELTSYTPLVIGALLLVTVVTAVVNAVGWAAAIWAVTEQAAGLPVGVGAALQYGLSRVVPMFGWFLAYGVIVALGLLLCVLPGLYFAVVGSLFSLVVVYERGVPPILRSIRLVHSDLGSALARVLLVFGGLLAAACVAGVFLAATGLAPVDEQGAVTGGSPVAAAVVDAVLTLPVNIFLLVGLLLTYTQLRARLEPISTLQLWTAVNRPPPPPAAGAVEERD